MKFTKDYLFPICPTQAWDCPYFDSPKCFMYSQEGCPPYLECECWESSDEAEELISNECMIESAGW